MTEEVQQLESTNPVPHNPVIEQAAPVQQVEKGPSLDDTLAATMAKIVADRPVKGEDGKFIAKAGAIDATPKLEVPGKPELAAPDPAKPVIAAPQSLPADVKAKWDALPPETQQWLATRESEIHKKITSDGERLKSLTAIDEALAPSNDFITQNNIPKPEYIRRLAAADHALRTNGPAALAEIARMYGINPQQPIGQHHQTQPVDPQINALTQKLGAIETTLSQQQKSAEAARVAESEAKVEEFKKTHPHFDKVEATMTKLYEPGMDLEKLYKMAVNADEELSATIKAEEDAKAKAAALEKQKADAAAAAKLAPFARKPGSVGVQAKAGNNWEDTMAQEHRRIKARG